ncbi:uncharacterized protein LOC144451875 [Glandiceps talaboti]
MFGGTPDGIMGIGSMLTCSEGLYVGTRKDNPLLEWFDEGFRKIKQSGKYAAICHRAEATHGKKGPIACNL